MRSQRSIIVAVIVTAAVSFTAASQMAAAESPARQEQAAATYQGKSVKWWANRTVQARKDANARGATLKALRLSLRHNQMIFVF